MRNILHIEMCEPDVRGSEVKCLGTKITLPDGTPVSGITKIEIIGQVDDVWRAVIHANVTIGRFVVVAEMAKGKHLSWWRRLLLKAAGVRYIEDTDLREEHYRQYTSLSLRRPNMLHDTAWPRA